MVHAAMGVLWPATVSPHVCRALAGRARCGVQQRRHAVLKCVIRQAHQAVGYTYGYGERAHGICSMCQLDIKGHNDTCTGECLARFSTGKVPYCVAFNPAPDRQHMFVAGMNDKKIVQVRAGPACV
jgi:hypothetical protein